jgi:hypothetical protein
MVYIKYLTTAVLLWPLVAQMPQLPQQYTPVPPPPPDTSPYTHPYTSPYTSPYAGPYAAPLNNHPARDEDEDEDEEKIQPSMPIKPNPKCPQSTTPWCP